VEWSWTLLGPREQALARRFAVFTGGASADAVLEVCGATEDTLADLVDKSIISVGSGRCRMLETIRLYCLERLDDSAEEPETRRAHALYWLEFARTADPHLLRAEQLDWLHRLGADHDNIHAALTWAVEHDRVIAYQLVAALGAYLWLSGRHGTIGRPAARLLAAGPAPDGLDEEYVSVVVHAVPRASTADFRRAAGALLRTVGSVRHPFGIAMYGMAIGPDPELGMRGELKGFGPWTEALGTLGEALLKLHDGQPAEAAAGLRVARRAFEALGERWGTAQTLDWLAVLAGRRGDWSEAFGLWSGALRCFDELGAAQEAADVYTHRADALTRRGDLDEAVADLYRAEELCARAGEPATRPDIPLGLGAIARLRGDEATAVGFFESALSIAEGAGTAATASRCRALAALGRSGEALALAANATRSALADVLEILGDPVQAAEIRGTPP
jgi:hypothetical protein